MQKNSYTYKELIDCGKGSLFGEGNAKLPLPPMLMFDRITEINKNAGMFKKGLVATMLQTVLLVYTHLATTTTSHVHQVHKNCFSHL